MFESFTSIFREYPIITFCLMVFIFASTGYLIVTRYLMEKQIRSFLPKTVFILIFSCSVSLLAMYLYEISHIHMSETLWDIILSIQVILCTIIIPALLLLKIPFATYQFPFAKIPVLAIVLILAYLRMLSVKSEEITVAKNVEN
jgi:hypothetical protein